MDNKNYVLCGMAFGDEGKGSFVDYLAHEKNIKNVVKYNGGSHASHTVITPNGIIHKFSQLSSGMFLNNSKTYLTENMVINIENLIEEAKQFAQKTNETTEEVLSRVFIHQNCNIVTPYHKLLNQLRELSKGENRRGSVGTGVSEAMFVLKTESLSVKARDLKSISNLQNKLKKIYQYMMIFIEENKQNINKNISSEVSESIKKGIEFLTNIKSVDYILNMYIDITKTFKLNICHDFNEHLKDVEASIYEGSQGLLIDVDYGIKPNTTMLDTTNKTAIDMLEKLKKNNVIKIGILKAFSSRHGMGLFPTEDESINKKIADENQSSSFWNGNIRFGWFDAVLARYSQTINKADEIFISSLDKLDGFSKVKVCNAYKYVGQMSDEFENLFEYENKNGEVIVKNIKKNSNNLIEYLNKCIPIYTEINGWKQSITGIKNKNELPKNCVKYIEELEKMIGIKISLISVGPTREQKIRMCEIYEA